VAAAAIGLDLVDELRMFRNPVVLGGGTPFLPSVTEELPLRLIETRTFGSRVIYERFRLALPRATHTRFATASASARAERAGARLRHRQTRVA
jgi:dihydrofolate reductase